MFKICWRQEKLFAPIEALQMSGEHLYDLLHNLERTPTKKHCFLTLALDTGFWQIQCCFSLSKTSCQLFRLIKGNCLVLFPLVFLQSGSEICLICVGIVDFYDGHFVIFCVFATASRVSQYSVNVMALILRIRTFTNVYHSR